MMGMLTFFILSSAWGAWRKPWRRVDPYPKMGSFFTTFYDVPNESDYSKDQTAQIKNMQGEVIASVNASFKKDLDVEGTGILRSGTTVNYAGRVDDEIRYRVSSAKWGWGVGQCALKPYHTIAVDPNIIPLGSLVYIPAIKGAVLPDGTVHDGFFYADDIGSRILHRHVDLFAQEGENSYQIYEKVGINTGTYVDIYKVKDPDPQGCQSKPPTYLTPRSQKWAASYVQGLVNLADEYAALGQTDQLHSALDKIHSTQGWWHLEGNEPSDEAVATSLEIQARSEIAARATEGDGSSLDSLEMVRYDREFNGDSLSPGEVVLTFDDGPHPRYSPVIHQTLKEGGAQAAFFEVGEMVGYHPELTKAYAQEGWVIGNHSFDHPDLTKLSDADVAAQINKTQEAIQKALGGPDDFNDYFQTFFARFFSFPRKLFAPEFLRSPYGARDQRTMDIITGTHVGQSIIDGKTQDDTFSHIMWDIDSLDWQDHSPASIEDRVFKQLEANNRRGVILMHDIHPQSALAFQLILPRLQKEGYKLVSLYDMVLEYQKKVEENLDDMNMTETRP